MRPVRLIFVAGAWCGALAAREAVAQSPSERSPASFVGTDHEAYRRAAELAGDLPAHQWTLRPFGPRDPANDRTGGRDPWCCDTLRSWVAGPRVLLRPAIAGAIFNSATPYGFNDGAVWAGRGATLHASGGFSAYAGPLSIDLYPTIFWAQNAPFTIVPNGLPGPAAFANATLAGSIDLPQRFGDKSYRRLDPGQSTVRLDIGGAALGASTANRFWGPALHDPLILGNNAAGIPHLFIGTSRPRNVGIGTLQGIAFWGRGTTSAYAMDASLPIARYATGAAATFTPGGLRNLELGAARYFHLQSQDGLPARFWFRTFQGLLKSSLAEPGNPGGDDPTDNQLASIYFRWAFPGAGFEVFGEYGREDHNWNARDLAGQPDHDAAFVLGFLRVWKRKDGGYATLGTEVVNSRFSHLNQALPQTVWFTHDGQGHTQLGQTIGGASVPGGGGATVTFTKYGSTGSESVRLRREMLAEVFDGAATPDMRNANVRQEVGFERMRRSPGAHRETAWALRLVYEFNRPAREGRNTLDLNATVRTTVW